MHLRPLSAVATLAALIGCAPRRAGAPTPAGAAPAAAVPPATSRPSDVVRLGPSALRYVLRQEIHAEQEFPGQTRTIDRGVRLFVSATITGPADSVGYPLTFTIDSIVPDSGTAIPPTVNFAASRGLRYTGRLAPTGEFRNPVPSDSARAQAFAQIAGGFVRTFFPRLPGGGATLGAEWTDTVMTTDRTVVEVTSRSLSHARAVAWEQRSGARCLRIEVAATYTLAGAGEQGGQPLEVAGSGTRATVQFVAADGRYVGGEFRDSSAIVITLPMQGAKVPVRQISRYTVTVLP
ncbi:MAG TPA: hypothetical protein VGQ25_13200 [Gemmatimonadales bacterium]|nr:hypothetical protein [Gemmatimonadales bacterium]